MGQLRSLPADIAVFAGRFGPFPAAQPAAFAHLCQVAPGLDLDHVEIVPLAGGDARLARHLDAGALAAIARDAAGMGDVDTLILVLPPAYEGLAPPDLPGLCALGTFRGRIHRMDAAR